jgi:phenylalanyl-tRNA synthetase beta chain
LGELKSKIRATLSAAGANEVLTYSFVSGQLLENAGQSPDNSYKITNSISPELQYVRQQIVPSLLEKARENLREGYDKFALFEMNQVFWKSEGLNGENVPVQFDNFGFVIVDSKNTAGYYSAKKYVDELALGLGLTVQFVPRDKPHEVGVYFEPKRSADLFIRDKRIGMVGEIKNSVADRFKLPHQTAAAEMGVDLILDAIQESAKNKSYQKKSRFPSVERDITFQAVSNLEYAKLENLICKTLEKQKLWFQYVPLSIYQGDGQATKNISFRLSFASYEKTLGGEEIAVIMDAIAEGAKKDLKAEVI